MGQTEPCQALTGGVRSTLGLAAWRSSGHLRQGGIQVQRAGLRRDAGDLLQPLAHAPQRRRCGSTGRWSRPRSGRDRSRYARACGAGARRSLRHRPGPGPPGAAAHLDPLADPGERHRVPAALKPTVQSELTVRVTTGRTARAGAAPAPEGAAPACQASNTWEPVAGQSRRPASCEQPRVGPGLQLGQLPQAGGWGRRWPGGCGCRARPCPLAGAARQAGIDVEPHHRA